jgi:hypothetical protein
VAEDEGGTKEPKVAPEPEPTTAPDDSPFSTPVMEELERGLDLWGTENRNEESSE